jgi:hypothetical protein
MVYELLLVTAVVFVASFIIIPVVGEMHHRWQRHLFQVYIVGVLFGFGQLVAGGAGLAQFAIGLAVGVGQIATGYVAIGQVVLAYYGLGQIGLAKFLWSSAGRDPEAVQFFHSWWKSIRHFMQ